MGKTYAWRKREGEDTQERVERGKKTRGEGGKRGRRKLYRSILKVETGHEFETQDMMSIHVNTLGRLKLRLLSPRVPLHLPQGPQPSCSSKQREKNERFLTTPSHMVGQYSLFPDHQPGRWSLGNETTAPELTYKPRLFKRHDLEMKGRFPLCCLSTCMFSSAMTLTALMALKP